MAQFKKYFTVSYDDGLEQDKQLLELMRRYGIRGTFNINSGLFGKKSDIRYRDKSPAHNVAKGAREDGPWGYADADRIPADEIRQVYEGMELATHGVQHRDLSVLSARQLEDELLRDREALQRCTELPVVGHAFPYGRSSAVLDRFLRDNGFLYARGVTSERDARGFAFPENLINFKPTCWHIEEDLEALVDRFIAAEPEDGDLLFFLWGHGYELDFSTLKGLRGSYERIFDKIAAHDEIVKCTNAEAFLAHMASMNPER